MTRSLLGVTLLALVASSAIWLRGPTLRFDVDRMGRHDSARLIKLRDDLRIIANWNPPYVTPQASDVLAQWIRLPDNSTAQRWEELGRSNVREFGLINGMIKLLRQEPDAVLSELRSLESAELSKELHERFLRIAEQRREASLAKIVSLAENRLLLDRWQVPPCPHSRVNRGIWQRVWGANPAAATAWARDLADAIDEQVWPVEQLYRVVESKDPFPLGPARDMQLVLKRLLSHETGGPTVIHAGHKSLSDWELWVRAKVDVTGEPDEAEARVISNQLHEWDTGIRLVCVPWAEEDSIRRPVWPPDASSVGCELPRLDDFLRDMGMPRALTVASATMKSTGDWSEPKVTLHVVLSSRQFPDWRHSSQLDLPLATHAHWRQSVTRAAMIARQDLRAHVLGLTRYCGCPARFAPSSKTATSPSSTDTANATRAVDVTLDHPQWGELRLSGTLDDDGRLVWSPLPPLEDRLRITQRLLTARPELEGHVARLVLTSISLAPERNQVEVRWRLRSLPGEAKEPDAIVWNTDTTSAERSAAPTVDGLPPAPPASATSGLGQAVRVGETLATEAELRKAIEEHLARDYGVLAKSVQVATTTTSAGIAVNLGVTISDWPELALGPITVATAGKAAESVDQLLAAESVRAAIQEQWHGEGGTFEHPRFGRIRSELEDWSPRQGRAKIRSSIQFPYLGEIDWAEKADAQLDGAWSRLDEVEQALEMRPDVDEALAAAQDEMLSWIGLDGVGRVEVDPQGIEGNRWLSMNPPRIALRCWAKIPFLGVKLRGDRCWLDQQGLHAPKKLGIAIPGTLTLPYFSLSEPAISIGVGERSMSVGGKVTPPAPPGPVNPWLKVGYTELAVGGELNEAGWNAPKLLGTGDIAVAGSTNVAHGGLGVDFRKGDIDGDFLAKAPLPGMNNVPARLDGRMAYRGNSGSFDMGGRGTVFDEEVANLNFLMGKKDAENVRPFDLTGRVRVPYVASVTVKGDAARQMDRYTIRGKGSAGPIVCRFKATEEGVKTETGVETGDGSTGYVEEWDPSLATLNMPEPGVEQPPPETQLRELVDSLPKRPLSEAEKRFARDHLSVEPDDDAREGAPETEVRESDTPPRAYVEYGTNAFKRDGATLIVRTPQERVLCRIPAEHYAGLEFNRQGLAMVIEWADRGGGEILFCQVDQGKWARVTFNADQTSRPAQVRMLDSLGLVNATVDPQSPTFAQQRDVLWRVLKVGFELGVLRSSGQGDVLRPQRLPFPESLDGYAFDIPPRADRGQGAPPNRRWLWQDDGALASIDLASPWVSREWESRADFAATVKQAERSLRSHLSRPIILATLVAATPPSDGFAEWSLGWVIHHRVDLPNDLLVWNTADGMKQLTLARHELPDEQLWSRGQATARGAWKKPSLSGRTAWIGAGGTFIDDDKRYWLVADRGLDDPECEMLSRQGWIDWTGDHARFLPRAWQSREARRGLPVEQLAQAVLRDWEAIRAEPDDFAVHPLGLLLLAGRDESSTRTP